MPSITFTLANPNAEGTTEVTLMRSRLDIEADPDLYRITCDTPTKLSEAVSEFNKKTKHHSIGASQPPLTSDEVVAAILRRQASDRDSTDPLLRVASSRMLQIGDELMFTPVLTSEKYHFTVWWIDLRTPGGGLRIRDRTLSSRSLTPDELAWRRFLGRALRPTEGSNRSQKADGAPLRRLPK